MPAKKQPVRKKRPKPRSGFRQGEAALRKYALGFPEAYEDFPWGERVIKVNKRIFVFMHGSTTELRVTTKLPQSYGAALLAPFCKPTGYGLGKSGWVSSTFVEGDQAPFDILRSWIDESYRAVAPKRLVKQLSE
jgi:predicted DNA-binding protein (MmcQ/YjbR family)